MEKDFTRFALHSMIISFPQQRNMARRPAFPLRGRGGDSITPGGGSSEKWVEVLDKKF